MKRFISFKESIKILKDAFNEEVSSEQLFLSESLGRVLANDIVAKSNSPEYETSGMDGYAIRYEDQDDGKIKIIDKLPAGTANSVEVTKGTCIKTFTGSLMSKGADTLIPIENVEVEGDYIIIKEKVPKGYSVRPVGENYKKGEVLIKKGTVIEFGEIGVMAGLNIIKVEVKREPVVSVLATGSEILELGEEQTNISQIRSTNHYTIEAIVKKAGAKTHNLGVVGDDLDSIKKAILNALEFSDIVITTGGVSVGDYDFVKDALNTIEAEVLISGVVIKPGMHIRVIRVGKKYIFALPGFPYSSAVTTILYVIPLIKRMLGLDDSYDIVYAKMREDYKKRSKKSEFVAVNLTYDKDGYSVDLKGKKVGTSAILTNLLNKPAFLWIEVDEGDLKKGDTARIIRV
ncbi:MAG: molybdopterin molybdotransferase MoeA [Epsilonproteobacteria bacterium]|nr:molybdopterin molybdotransferase MoeA [Campylobacterota bacterium]